MSAVTSALQNKLDAIHDLVLALTARKTYTGDDDIVINPTLTALDNATDNIEAQMSAATAPTLAAPTAADATALQNAIQQAENAIAPSASISQLANAARVLIGTYVPSAAT